MDWLASDWFKIIITLLTGGGIATLIRSIGQNRTDRQSMAINERTQLSQEQSDFRSAMAAQLARLDTRITDLDRRNDLLEAQALEHVKQIEVLKAETIVLERQVSELQKQNHGQANQLTEQATQIHGLTEEKAHVIQRLQVVEAQKTFLERETNQLRQENMRLREKLPQRVESAQE